MSCKGLNLEGHTVWCNQIRTVWKWTHFRETRTNDLFLILKTPTRPYSCLAKVTFWSEFVECRLTKSVRFPTVLSDCITLYIKLEKKSPSYLVFKRGVVVKTVSLIQVSSKVSFSINISFSLDKHVIVRNGTWTIIFMWNVCEPAAIKARVR